MTHDEMTHDEIIEMASKAGLGFIYDDFWSTYMDVGKQEIVAFAKLVAAKATKKEQDRCCAIVFAQCGSDNVAQRTVNSIRGKV